MHRSIAALCLVGLASTASAKRPTPADLSLEINYLGQVESACQLTFVA